MSDTASRVHCSQVAATCSPVGDRITVDLSLVDARGKELTLALGGEEAIELATQILATVHQVIVHQQRAPLPLN